MNKDELLNKLHEYGVKKYNNENYYLDIASYFAKKYVEYFDEAKIVSTLDSQSMLEASKLPVVNYNGISSLILDNKKVFYYEDKPCFEIDMKLNVLSYWVNDEKYQFNIITSALDYINSLNDEKRFCLLGEFDKLQEELLLLKYAYNYVLYLLEEMIVTKIDSVRVGLFKNAYFDILNFVPINMEVLKR